MDNRAQEKLVKDNLPFVISIAKQYVGKGLDMDDLVNEGNLGMIRAAEKFDESRGYSFLSYAVWWIRQSIEQAIAEQSRIVSMPAREVGEVNRINRLRALFEQENERRPNINEIAEAANVSEHDVKKTMKTAGNRSVSVDAPFSGSNPTTLLDLMSSDDEEETTDRQTVVEAIRSDIREALRYLSDRERNVLMAFYGIGQPEMTFAEIGKRYSMTRERARQIRKKALRHLRSKSQNKALKNYLQ